MASPTNTKAGSGASLRALVSAAERLAITSKTMALWTQTLPLAEICDPVAVAVPTGVPDAPTGLTATPGSSSAAIAFTAGDDGGEPITNYSYSLDGVTFVALDPAVVTSPIILAGLTDGKAYSVTLKAVNTNGVSPASAAVSFSLDAAEVVPVPLPPWLFGMLIGLIGWLGHRRFKMA